MTKRYILIRAFVFAAGLAAMVFSQSDTLVLNQTEFRFPETHPGEVFQVKKVVIGGKGLGKGVAADVSTGHLSRFPKNSAPLANRDLRGRSVQGGEYQKRMARIQQKHDLPTLAASVNKPGQPFKVPKNFQMPEGGRIAFASNSPLIQSPQDLTRMEKIERQAVRRKYGALSPEFSREVEALEAGQVIDVSIELAVQIPGYVNGMTATLEEQKANAKEWAHLKPLVRGEELVRSYGLKTNYREGESPSARHLKVQASKIQLQRLAQAYGVVSIQRDRVPHVAASMSSGPLDYQTLLNSAYNPPEEMEFYGVGGVATMESGLLNSFVDWLPYDLKPPGYVSMMSGVDTIHSEATYYLLSLGTPYTQHHHFVDVFFENITDSIINNDVRSISTSWVSLWDGDTAADSRWVDNLAYVYPYPTISLAAGNGDAPYYTNPLLYVPWSRTYNSLIVGNVQHYNGTHYAIDTKISYGGPEFNEYWSSAKNPPAKYGSVSDWELPSLVAPGYTQDPGSGFYLGGLASPGHIGPNRGTSLSAPVTAAIVANTYGVFNTSYAAPQKSLATRVALLLTAQNVDSGYWYPSVYDSRDGAGTVSGSSSVAFIKMSSELDPENGPAIQGYYNGYTDSTSWEQPQLFSYLVPSEKPAGKHLRVVLSWTSSPSIDTVENEISDFDLYVENVYGWKVSGTWNSNTEIVDIPSSDLVADTQYDILVDKYAYRKASDGPEFLYYTVAWTWVKDHAD